MLPCRHEGLVLDSISQNVANRARFSQGAAKLIGPKFPVSYLSELWVALIKEVLCRRGVAWRQEEAQRRGRHSRGLGANDVEQTSRGDLYICKYGLYPVVSGGFLRLLKFALFGAYRCEIRFHFAHTVVSCTSRWV